MGKHAAPPTGPTPRQVITLTPAIGLALGSLTAPSAPPPDPADLPALLPRNEAPSERTAETTIIVTGAAFPAPMPPGTSVRTAPPNTFPPKPKPAPQAEERPAGPVTPREVKEARTPKKPSRTARRIERAAVTQDVSRLLDVARAYFGVPYLWGGVTPDGWDCSGYTSFVFRQVGITIPRNSRAQREAAAEVRSPKPGDLVFFHSSTGRVFHVGIYAGSGYMYDAPRPGKVTGKHRIWSDRVSYGRFG